MEGIGLQGGIVVTVQFLGDAMLGLDVAVEDERKFASRVAIYDRLLSGGPRR